jgi:hypothetical protein
MEGDLASFVEHATSVVAGEPSLSRRTTDLRITLPLLRTLGWNVHGSEVAGEYRVPDDATDEAVTVDYALLLDGEPAVFVVTAGLGAGVDREHGNRLERAMAAAGVDYGMVAGGDTFVLVAGGVEDPERVQCSVGDLRERQSALARFSRAATRRRRQRERGSARRDAASELATNREAVASALGECLADGVTDPVRTELRATGAALVDGVVAALADGDHPTTAVGGTGETAVDPPASTSAGGDDVDGRDGEAPDGGDGGTDGSSAFPSDAGEPSTGTGGPGTETGNDDRVTDPRNGTTSAASRAGGDDPDAPDGDLGSSRPGTDDGNDDEYVVRFFDGSNSVGAVGHGTSPGALVQALEYLVERRGLEGNVELPWGPSDDRAVLSHAAVHPDGTEMVDAAQLSNGYYVCTTIGPGAIREALSEIADATGLRVMFQGDW